MNYMLFWALLFVLATGTFSFSYSYGGIDRTFKGLNKGVAESSVDILEKSASGAPQFAVALFKKNAKSYLAYNLEPYLQGHPYVIEYSYFGEDRKEISAEPAYCSGLSISFEAPVIDMATYRNEVTFWIKKGTNYE